MKDNKRKAKINNVILVHVARTWERIRLRQPFKEMPQDNIQSAERGIQDIADEILNDYVIQKLINYKKDDWSWEVMTDGYADFSDTYIESRATEIIHNYYL